MQLSFLLFIKCNIHNTANVHVYEYYDCSFFLERLVCFNCYEIIYRKKWIANKALFPFLSISKIILELNHIWNCKSLPTVIVECLRLDFIIINNY